MSITQEEALDALADGHTIWSVDYAKEICEVFGVELPKSLVEVWESDRHPLGVTMIHGPDKGVWSLSLSAYIAKCLGVDKKAQSFLGRGSQAREYARVIRNRMIEEKKKT